MPLLTLSWPFAPFLSCLSVCLAGSRRVVFSTVLLFCRWITFPLIIAVLSLRPLLSMSTNFYSLRAARPPPPHCVEKFRPQFGDLYWPSTWSQLFCFNLDHPVIDLSWKVAHGVLCTADRLIGFGYDIDATCFYNTALQTPSHLFFLALSHKVTCPGFSLLCSPTPPLARLLSVVMYCNDYCIESLFNR